MFTPIQTLRMTTRSTANGSKASSDSTLMLGEGASNTASEVGAVLPSGVVSICLPMVTRMLPSCARPMSIGASRRDRSFTVTLAGCWVPASLIVASTTGLRSRPSDELMTTLGASSRSKPSDSASPVSMDDVVAPVSMMAFTSAVFPVGPVILTISCSPMTLAPVTFRSGEASSATNKISAAPAMADTLTATGSKPRRGRRWAGPLWTGVDVPIM